MITLAVREAALADYKNQEQLVMVKKNVPGG